MHIGAMKLLQQVKVQGDTIKNLTERLVNSEGKEHLLVCRVFCCAEFECVNNIPAKPPWVIRAMEVMHSAQGMVYAP